MSSPTISPLHQHALGKSQANLELQKVKSEIERKIDGLTSTVSSLDQTMQNEIMTLFHAVESLKKRFDEMEAREKVHTRSSDPSELSMDVAGKKQSALTPAAKKARKYLKVCMFQ